MTDFISTEVSNIEGTEEQVLMQPNTNLQHLPPLPDNAEGGSWVQMEDMDIINMFSELPAYKDGTGKVEWDKLDYEIYGEDWYREKYPNFPDEWYALMVEASKKKFQDLQKKEKEGMTIEKGNFIISFD